MRSPSRAAAQAATAPARAACTDLKRTRVPKYSVGRGVGDDQGQSFALGLEELGVGAAGARGEAPVDVAGVVAVRRTRATPRTPCRGRAKATAHGR